MKSLKKIALLVTGLLVCLNPASNARADFDPQHPYFSLFSKIPNLPRLEHASYAVMQAPNLNRASDLPKDYWPLFRGNKDERVNGPRFIRAALGDPSVMIETKLVTDLKLLLQNQPAQFQNGENQVPRNLFSRYLNRFSHSPVLNEFENTLLAEILANEWFWSTPELFEKALLTYPSADRDFDRIFSSARYEVAAKYNSTWLLVFENLNSFSISLQVSHKKITGSDPDPAAVVNDEYISPVSVPGKTFKEIHGAGNSETHPALSLYRVESHDRKENAVLIVEGGTGRCTVKVPSEPVVVVCPKNSDMASSRKILNRFELLYLERPKILGYVYRCSANDTTCSEPSWLKQATTGYPISDKTLPENWKSEIVQGDSFGHYGLHIAK